LVLCACCQRAIMPLYFQKNCAMGLVPHSGHCIGMFVESCA
jgi:hypothetical protein